MNRPTPWAEAGWRLIQGRTGPVIAPETPPEIYRRELAGGEAGALEATIRGDGTSSSPHVLELTYEPGPTPAEGTRYPTLEELQEAAHYFLPEGAVVQIPALEINREGWGQLRGQLEGGGHTMIPLVQISARPGTPAGARARIERGQTGGILQ